MTTPTGDAAFYDRIARRFGGYSSGVRPRLVFPGDNPEEVFRELVLASARRARRVLDVGSGDGHFTLAVAAHAPVVVGIDVAELMLGTAEARRRASGIANVHFIRQDGKRMAFADATFDVAYSRRGPLPLGELGRVLKPGGSLVHIGIGERDALQLKQVFGRGQGFARLGQSWLANSCEAQRRTGFSIEIAREFDYDEFYASAAELELFLQAVPIFDAFPLAGDHERLRRYTDAASIGAEVRLPRHRFVTLATR